MDMNRIGRVRVRMAEIGLDKLVVSDPSSIYYLTGIYIQPGERMLALLLSPDEVTLFVNALFPVEPVEGLKIVVQSDGFDPTPALADDIGKCTLGVDKAWPARFLLGVMERSPETTIKLGSAAVDDTRMYKDASELEQMREASAANDRVIEQAINSIKAGMTERQLADIIREAYVREGLIEDAFPPLVCFGVNGAFPHHSTDDTPLKIGDSITIDIGRKLGMYCCDMTRTVFFGEVSDEQRKVYDIVNAANAAGEAAVKPGVRLCDVDKAARELITKAGYGEYFTHRLGHGCGIDVHEPPDVSATNELPAGEGMVFSCEPGVYLPGKFGVRVEDLVAVTKDGCEVLNHFTHELIVVKA